MHGCILLRVARPAAYAVLTRRPLVEPLRVEGLHPADHLGTVRRLAKVLCP